MASFFSQLKLSVQLVAQWFVLATGLHRLMEGLLIRRNGGSAVRIFFGHHVTDDGLVDKPLSTALSDLQLTRSQFRRILKWLSSRYEILSLMEAVARLQTGERPKRGIAVITFDDGYRDNLTNAIPELAALGIPATIFVATAPIAASERLWYDQVREWLAETDREQITVSWASQPLSLTNRSQAAQAIIAGLKQCETGERRLRTLEIARALGVTASAPLPPHETVTAEELLAMAAMPGIEIGGHTVNHPMLENTNNDEARREIMENAVYLESALGMRPRTFAYPFGSFTDEHIAMLQEAGYEAAVTVVKGLNLPGQDLYRLMRIPLCSRLCQLAWQDTVRPLLRARCPASDRSVLSKYS
jgi:peptidoglycan/xylan/chitin deacetylase (PgdA/CDA1 family)